MTTPSAAGAGPFRIGGDIEINRLGFGAMRVVGPGIWGPPEDRPEALRTLGRLVDLGVNFVDTADCYGPNVSEEIVREVLHPYPGMLIATKAGLLHEVPNKFELAGDPDRLRRQTEGSLKRLGVDRIDLWQLHRIDPKVSRADQFGAIRRMIDDGIIRHAGLSEVSVADIREAQDYFPVATVQNLYNLTDRKHEDVLDFCEAQNIGFIPWFPLAAGDLTREGSALDTIVKAHGATPGQIALAWTLRRSPVMLPIPGTSKVAHLEQNVAAAAIRLSDEEYEALDKAGRAVA